METINFQELLNIYNPDGQVKDKFTIFTNGVYKFDDGTKLEVNEEFKNNLLKAFKSNARGQRIPITKEHQDGEAYGWIDDVILENSQVNIKVTWTELGKEVLDKKLFAYNSPEIIFNYKDTANNQVYPVVLRAGSLTNFPKIKRTNSVIQGFAEDKKEEEKLRTLEEITSQLKSISNELKGHPELYRKPGTPQAKVLLRNALQNIEKYLIAKEEKTMEDNSKQETAITMAEVNKIVEDKQKQMEIAFSEKMEAIKKEADEKVKLAEEKANIEIKKLIEENFRKDDEMLLSEAIRNGQILPQDKNKYRKDLQIARIQGVVKLSETETIDSYSREVEKIKALPVVKKYGEVKGSSYIPEDKVTWQEVKNLAEEKQKAGMSRHLAVNAAMVETGYSFQMCEKA